MEKLIAYYVIRTRPLSLLEQLPKILPGRRLIVHDNVYLGLLWVRVQLIRTRSLVEDLLFKHG